MIPVARGAPLQPEEWCSYMNDEGVIENVCQLKERIFRGVGIIIPSFFDHLFSLFPRHIL